jgi:hypothetical protein
MHLAWAGAAGFVLFALVGVAAGDSVPVRALAVAGMLASFLTAAFGILLGIDRFAGAARVRQALLGLIGLGILLAAAGVLVGAETAVRIGGRAALFGVMLTLLRTDYVIIRLGIGPRVATVATAFLAVALVLDQLALDYPSAPVRAAANIARLAGAFAFFFGFCRTAWLALRRASGRDTTSG